MQDSALIFDTETTGLKEPELVEAAYLKVFLEDCKTKVVEEFNERYKPTKVIEFGALSTHNIKDEDLINCPPSSSFSLPFTEYIIGHNVDFDWDVIGKPDIRRIDTLCMSKDVWPGLGSYKQGSILYFLERSTATEVLKGAHAALDDIYICKTILDAILQVKKINSFLELWLFSEECRKVKTFPFGDFKDRPFSEVDTSLLLWCLRKKTEDRDFWLREACKQELKNR